MKEILQTPGILNVRNVTKELMGGGDTRPGTEVETLELGHNHHNTNPNEKRANTRKVTSILSRKIISQSYHKLIFHSGSLVSTLNRLLLLLTMQNGGMDSASFGAIFTGRGLDII